MNVVGLTTPREVMIASREHNFRMSEFLMVEDPVQGELLGEVIDAQTYNRFIPMDMGGDFVDRGVIASLETLGYDINNETIYIGKLRFLYENMLPVITGSEVRLPRFDEISQFLAPTAPSEGWSVGIIRNTDHLYDEAPHELKGLMRTLEEDGIHQQGDLPYIMDVRGMHQYPHLGIFGGSGSGKSFGLRVLLEELMDMHIPGMVLDPHFEMDFSQAAPGGRSFERLHDRYQIGVDVGIRFEDLSPGEFKNLLPAVSGTTEAMNSVIDTVFKRGNSFYIFQERLNDLLEGHDIGGMEKILQRQGEAKAALQEGGDPNEVEKWTRIYEIFNSYGKSTNSASVRGVLWRVQSLHHMGIFQEDSRKIEESLRQGKLAVIQGSTKLIAVYATYLIKKLYQKRRDYKDARFLKDGAAEFFPPFFIITDESHNFAPKGTEAPAKGVLREIAQEGRKYGVFLMLATQRPTLLDDTVTAQLNTKLIFRTVRASDIDTIREETDLSREETARLPYLRTGDVFVSSAQRGRSTYARIRMAHSSSPHTENPFDELKGQREAEERELMGHLRPHLPINAATDLLRVSQELAQQGLHHSQNSLRALLDRMVAEGLISLRQTPLGDRYEEVKS
ncbi:MAG: ATP-binding protein [Tissierellia bacterium]|nr:ATP-binding protein [Tissierellia bacterium]